jgi:hypothetical protein
LIFRPIVIFLKSKRRVYVKVLQQYIPSFLKIFSEYHPRVVNDATIVADGGEELSSVRMVGGRLVHLEASRGADALVESQHLAKRKITNHP